MKKQGSHHDLFGRIGFWLAGITLSLGLTPYLLAQGGSIQASNSITGGVYDENGRPLSDVDVELQDEYYKSVGNRGKTSFSGRFIFNRLIPGRYRVRVMPFKYGYDEQVQDVDLASNNRGTASFGSEIATLDFRLRKRIADTDSLGVANAIFAQEVPKTAEELYVQAISDLREKKETACILKLKQALEILPNYFLALDLLGKEYLKQEDFPAALDYLGKAAVVNPKGASTLYGLGYAHMKLKQPALAIDNLRRSVSLSQNPTQPLLLLGTILRQTGKYSESETELKKAKELSKGKLADVHWQLALLYGPCGAGVFFRH